MESVFDGLDAYFATHKFVDILYDDIFKLIFTKPENRDLLLALLREVLPDLDISDVSLANNEQLPIARHKKRSTFDVHCTTSDGATIIVEVQHKSIPDYTDRMLYYSAFPVLTQHKAGDENYALSPVYIVSFINFALRHKNDWNGYKDIVSSYSIREDGNGEMMTDNLHFVYVELGRFQKGRMELVSVTDWWFFCLKNMKDFDSVPEDLGHDIIRRLMFATLFENLSGEEKEEIFKTMTTQIDINIWKREAREEGLREGREEGREEGRKEGRKEATLENARNLKRLGIQDEIIIKATGLSEEEVRSLQK